MLTVRDACDPSGAKDEPACGFSEDQQRNIFAVMRDLLLHRNGCCEPPTTRGKSTASAPLPEQIDKTVNGQIVHKRGHCLLRKQMSCIHESMERENDGAEQDASGKQSSSNGHAHASNGSTADSSHQGQGGFTPTDQKRSFDSDHAAGNGCTRGSSIANADAPGKHTAKNDSAAVNGSNAAVNGNNTAQNGSPRVVTHRACVGGVASRHGDKNPCASDSSMCASSCASASSPRPNGWRSKVPSRLCVGAPEGSSEIQDGPGADRGREEAERGEEGGGLRRKGAHEGEGAESGKINLAIEQLAPLGLSLRCVFVVFLFPFCSGN
jgi:hypothetical protein